MTKSDFDYYFFFFLFLEVIIKSWFIQTILNLLLLEYLENQIAGTNQSKFI